MKSDVLDYKTIVEDLQCAANKYIGVNHFKVLGASVILRISDHEGNARAYPSARDQYTVTVYRNMLESCLNYVEETVDAYHSTLGGSTLFDKLTFKRSVCSCMTEYLFLHEYCHVIRGHFNFLESRKPVWGGHPELKRADKRFVESDADIYAGNILLARTYSVFKDPRNPFRLRDLMQAYVVGVRSLFEVLLRRSGVEDLIHEDSDHPHSLIRAYIAVTMGVSGSISEKMGEDAEECRAIAVLELLKYQRFLDKYAPVDAEFLQRNFEREIDVWTTRTSELAPYYLLEVGKVSSWTKFREMFGK